MEFAVLIGLALLVTAITARMSANRSHARLDALEHIVEAQRRTLDELSLLCEPAREGLDRGLLQSRLQHALREQTGLSIAVQVLERDRVPRSEGKAVRVVDRRPR